MAWADTWRMATCEEGGKPLIFRIRESPPPLAQPNQFPHLLAVCWQYEPTNQFGMPSEEVAGRMSQLEGLLQPTFEGTQQAFLTVVFTGDGMREWQWYARNPEELMRLVNELLGELEPFPVEFRFRDDPDWTEYKEILEIPVGNQSASPDWVEQVDSSGI